MSKNIKRFSISIFVIFSSYSLVITQAVPFLTDLGYSPSQRGLVLSFVGIISIVGQILMGFLSDRFGTIKKFFIYLTILMALLVGLSFLVETKNFMYHFLILGMAMGLTKILVNLYETWIMEVDSMRDDFGFIRGFGSIGWALASLASGYLISAFSYEGLAYACALLSIIFVFLSIDMEDAEKQTSMDIKMSDIKTLFKNKTYVRFLIVYFIAYFVYNADAVTVTDLMVNLGATPTTIGIKWFVQALCELPMMLLGARILLKYKGHKVMVFASVMMLIRMALLGVAPNNLSIILISTLQALTYPFILMSQKKLVYEQLPAHLRSTGQMVAVSLTAGLAAVLMPITSGILIEHMDIQMVLVICAALMIIPIMGMRERVT